MFFDKDGFVVIPPFFRNKSEKLIAKTKFFMPDTNRYWLAVGFDGKDTFYGLVICEDKVAMEYFSFAHLKELRGSDGSEVQMDLEFQPTAINEILSGVLMIREG